MKKAATSFIHIVLCVLVLITAILGLTGIVDTPVNLMAAGVLIGAMGLEYKITEGRFRFVDVMFLLVGVLCLVTGVVAFIR